MARINPNVAPYNIAGLLPLERLTMKRTFTTPRMRSWNLNKAYNPPPLHFEKIDIIVVF